MIPIDRWTCLHHQCIISILISIILFPLKNICFQVHNKSNNNGNFVSYWFGNIHFFTTDASVVKTSKNISSYAIAMTCWKTKWSKNLLLHIYSGGTIHNHMCSLHNDEMPSVHIYQYRKQCCKTWFHVW